jgi:hypothetical protein
LICEVDSIAPMLAAASGLDDVISPIVNPVVTAEQGMELAEHMA